MTNHLPSVRLAIAVALSFVVSSPAMGQLAAAEGVEQSQERSRESGAEERPGRDTLRAEIQRLQESLGGPQVDRFPSLRARGFGIPAVSGRSWEGRSSIPREAIRALRDAAAQLDVTANRLEQLELFTQADDLRQQAQRLRVDARGMSGVQPTPAPTPGPRPATWGEPQYDLQQLWRDNAPVPREAPTPSRLDPAPQPEPVPQPEIPSDPPKPQPLLDSPEATPQPDVEVEG